MARRSVLEVNRREKKEISISSHHREKTLYNRNLYRFDESYIFLMVINYDYSVREECPLSQGNYLSLVYTNWRIILNPENSAKLLFKLNITPRKTRRVIKSDLIMFVWTW